MSQRENDDDNSDDPDEGSDDDRGKINRKMIVMEHLEGIMRPAVTVTAEIRRGGTGVHRV